MFDAADWPFPGLRRNHYRCILADPPWSFKAYSSRGHKKTPHAHYTCMNLADIKRLPVADLAAPDCALVMWCTAPHMQEGMDVIRAWGFSYKSMGAWGKLSRTGRKWACGTGYRYRSAAEFWMLATRGNPKQKVRNARNLIVAPLREHSRKPDHMRGEIEAMFDGPFAELFARSRTQGWDCSGDQLDRFPEQPRAERAPLPVPPASWRVGP